MKNFISFIFAGLLGGIVCFGGIKYLNFKNAEANNEILDHAEAKEISYASPLGVMPTDFTIAAERSLDAVVHIKVAKNNVQEFQRNNRSLFRFFNEEMRPTQGSGSGVIINDKGYIVTNNHVVDFADDLEVTLHDGRIFKAVKIGSNPNSDLAVIKIEADGLKPITYGNSDDVKVGEWALAVGNPFDLTSTVTAGIISAKGRNLGIINRNRNYYEDFSQDDGSIEDFIQTDAAVNPGNSGGALVDIKGNLIGINSAIATPTGTYAGYAFAIPVNLMKGIVDNIIRNNGKYWKPALGVTAANVKDLSQSDKSEYGIKSDEGVLILELNNGGAAQFAGLLPNDVITQINQKKISSLDDLKIALASIKKNEILNVKLLRGKTEKLIPVTIRG